MTEPAQKTVTRMLANPTEMPVTPEQVTWARCRPPHLRTPIPTAGDRVQYRHTHYGELSEAEVESVEISDPHDYGVWRYVLDNGAPVKVGDQYVMEMVEDPWVDVILRTDYGRIVTREARIGGSAGWLPYP